MSHKKIFFIEDEKEIIDLYSTQLEKHGYSIDSFRNGNEALVKIDSITKSKLSPPQVVILDLLLPDISGLAILGELRSKPIFDGTLIIVFTNYVSESLQESVKQLNKVIYLSKVDTAPSILLEIIQRKVG